MYSAPSRLPIFAPIVARRKRHDPSPTRFWAVSPIGEFGAANGIAIRPAIVPGGPFLCADLTPPRKSSGASCRLGASAESVPHAANFLGERPSEILAEVFGRSTRGVENRYSRAACIFSYSPRCSREMERRPLARRRAGPLSAFQHDVDAAVRDARVARSGFADPYLAERRTIEPVLR
jgi:hypothetical protein